jgi:hypothetical protein
VAEQTQYEFSAVTSKDILQEHERSWEGFVQFATWSLVATAVLLLGLLFFVV